MGIPDKDHVLRHVPFKKLLRDDQGNIHGLLPQAFELRNKDNGKLSVNWLEYFRNPSHHENINSTVQALRMFRDIKTASNCGYGVGNVKVIKDVCKSCGVKKVDIVHSSNNLNKSHSSILRLPPDDLNLMASLAEDAFNEVILNKNIS